MNTLLEQQGVDAVGGSMVTREVWFSLTLRRKRNGSARILRTFFNLIRSGSQYSTASTSAGKERKFLILRVPGLIYFSLFYIHSFHRMVHCKF